MFGAQAAIVDVDRKTGEVAVKKFIAAQNVGKAINPATVRQQIEGSVVMGVSNTLYESVVRNDGCIQNANFHDYKISTALDVPEELITIIVECPDPLGPYGAKGVGEPAIIPTSGALVNAIADAIGVEVHSSSLRLENILDLINGDVNG